ncbi:hypothetical protein FSP39_021086 [Pinctada imbricata]|uniref:DED domain-containing protein n=1 Tax=Pinctada imbricata TaxID=66713 RepID=A0AA88XP81_PINIB|nr:hypothetical protein FSP39_021086 [Pinctada imbricata]
MAAAAGTKDLTNINPPDDWELNTFLLEVSDMLDEGDLRRMKSLCRGTGGFGKGVLERLTSPLDFFDLLRQTDKLSRHNLLFLQGLIWSIGRKDIHKRFVSFGREIKEVLHFFAPKDSPAHVARLLRVPESFVFIGGIEPSSSLLITFMVPEDVLYIMLELTDEEQKGLVLYDVDNIVIDDKAVSLKGAPLSDSRLDEVSESRMLLEKGLKQEKEIESLQIKLFEANKALKQHRTLNSAQAEVWLILLSFLYRLFCATARSRLSPQIPSFKTITAQYLQRRMLRICREQGYNEDIICNLMDATATIVMEYVRIKEEVATTALMQTLKTLQNENVVLQYKIENLLFRCSVKGDDKILSETDEFFLSHVLRRRPVALNVKIETVEHQIDRDHLTKVLKTLSKSMTRIERMKILNHSRLTQEEKTFVQDSPDQLLLAMLNKETQSTGVDISAWLKNILLPLGNQKLLQKGLDMINTDTKSNTSSQYKKKRARSVGPDVHIRKGEHVTSLHGEKSPTDRQGTTSKSKSEASCENSTQNNEQLNEKMDKMVEMMNAMQRDIAVLNANNSYSPLSFLSNENKFRNILNQDIFS